MKRTQIYLDEEQEARLARRASAAGVTRSRLIRQAIDAYLEGRGDEGLRRERFLAALDDLAADPLDLPEGRAYVEHLRTADLRRQEELERRRG
ncbi:MAG: CopG family transcriptional regulator [Actinomycetota bacterium]